MYVSNNASPTIKTSVHPCFSNHRCAPTLIQSLRGPLIGVLHITRVWGKLSTLHPTNHGSMCRANIQQEANVQHSACQFPSQPNNRRWVGFQPVMHCQTLTPSINLACGTSWEATATLVQALLQKTTAEGWGFAPETHCKTLAPKHSSQRVGFCS